MTPTKGIKLSGARRRLRDELGVSVSYRRLYAAVLDGIVPAERDASGSRWLIDPRSIVRGGGPAPVVRVDHEMVPVREWRMAVRMAVRLGAFPALVLMLVMPVMHVDMFMVQLLMNML